MMAALMIIGQHLFQAVGLNGQEIETTTEANWVDVPRFGMVDGAQMHGFSRPEMSIRGVLFPDQLGGLPDYEALKASQGLGRPLPLLRMGRGFVGFFLGQVTIESISDLESYGGKKIAFTIELKGYS
jgi:phage protein U